MGHWKRAAIDALMYSCEVLNDLYDVIDGSLLPYSVVVDLEVERLRMKHFVISECWMELGGWSVGFMEVTREATPKATN